jgi:hypothetical protein
MADTDQNTKRTSGGQNEGSMGRTSGRGSPTGNISEEDRARGGQRPTDEEKDEQGQFAGKTEGSSSSGRASPGQGQQGQARGGEPQSKGPGREKQGESERGGTRGGSSGGARR